ncbi:hypothetical protein VTK26DRAFT_7601 [Humicola hyalothermophila]
MDPKERFHRQFQSSAAALQEQIVQLSSFAAVGGERQDAVEHILSSISRLSSELADASADYLPAYDQRTYSDVIKALRDQLNETTAKFAPKSRFQFKRNGGTGAPTTTSNSKPDTRRLQINPTASTSSPSPFPSATEADSVAPLPTITNTASTSKNYNAEIAHPTGAEGGVRKPSFSTARDITLSDHTRVHIMLPASASRSRATSAGTLTHLRQCVVDMSEPTTRKTSNDTTTTSSSSSSSTTTTDATTPPSAPGGAQPFASLMLQDIESSVIVAGHVDGPVHVTGVRDSVVVVAARQVRVHECEGTTFYLHCASRPIIEDCKGVRFARAPGCYLSDKQKTEANMFDQVDDFKWLKATPSPNWSLLPDEEAIPEDQWQSILAGRPGVGVEDILQKMGIWKGS